jgi:hypothetical protein
MIMHNLQFKAEEETQVVFECENCLQSAGFVKEGYGDPHVEIRDGIWHLPDDAGAYFNPCFKACPTCRQPLPEPEELPIEDQG